MTIIPMPKRPGHKAPGRRGFDQLPGTIDPSIALRHERRQFELRVYAMADRLHQLGPLPISELFVELIDIFGAPVWQRLEAYSRLDPQFIRAMGGDRLAPDIEIAPDLPEAG